LYPSNIDKLRIATHKVKIFIPVEKFTETAIDVPVKVKSILKNNLIKVYPDKVKVSVQVAVKDYKKINSDLFNLEADLGSVFSNNENKLQVKVVSKPDFVRNLKISPERVEFIVFK